jgi:hypothetical protein
MRSQLKAVADFKEVVTTGAELSTKNYMRRHLAPADECQEGHKLKFAFDQVKSNSTFCRR